MLDRICAGRVPRKPHLVFRSPAGALHYEECITRGGFDGAYSILYHEGRPHEAEPVDGGVAGFAVPMPDGPHASSATAGLQRRHYRCLELGPTGGGPLQSRRPLLFNADVVVGFVRPEGPDPVYFVNSDADDLFFILRGQGTLRSVFGDLRFTKGDYLCVPKGTLHRFVPDPGEPQAWLSIECKGGMGLPPRYRNAVGQLKMDAPYSHRDFRRPDLVGPLDEHLRDIVVKRADRFFTFRARSPPLDVVGWDGAAYPFVLPILAFQPRVGQVHLPPPVHTTFEARGVQICSFVPRPLDFHAEANPCPYPHSSVDVDEVLFYANSAFGSRRGVGEGSLSHHPAGIPHGPHPGAYENAPGTTHTEEIAVMLDCHAPLQRTPDAVACEEPGYHASFRAGAT
jgi:homogentisate 1,2-dioxygenase